MSDSIIMQVDEATKGLIEQVQSDISSAIEDQIRDVKNNVQEVNDNTETILKKFKNFDGLGSSVEQLKALAEESKQFTTIVSPLQDSISGLKEDSKETRGSIEEQQKSLSLVSQSLVELETKLKGTSEGIMNACQDIASNAHSNHGEILDKLSSIQSSETEGQKLIASHIDTLSKTEGERLLEIKAVLTDISQEHGERLSQAITSLLTIEEKLAGISTAILEIQKHQEQRIEEISTILDTMHQFQKSFLKKYEENETVHYCFEKTVSEGVMQLQAAMEKSQYTLDIIVNLVTPFWKRWSKKKEEE